MTQAFEKFINVVPRQHRYLIRKGILVVPIKTIYMKYHEKKNEFVEKIYSGNEISSNTMHKTTSIVPLTHDEINGINDIVWYFVREYYGLWNKSQPSYSGGFSIIYNDENNTELEEHVDDSLYTVNMCIRKTHIDGNEIVFSGSKSNCYDKTFTNRYQFVITEEDYVVIHMGNHPHKTNKLIEGERANIVLWFK